VKNIIIDSAMAIFFSFSDSLPI